MPRISAPPSAMFSSLSLYMATVKSSHIPSMTSHDLFIVTSIRIGANVVAKAHALAAFFISVRRFSQGFVDLFLACELIVPETWLDWKT